MILTPPNSTELKGSSEQSPTTQLELPEPIISIKKQARKAPRRNHSEIERRRRERLNCKYNELRELVPACRAFRFARRGGDAGLHKLDILSEAVRYIEELEERLKPTTSVPQVSPPQQNTTLMRHTGPLDSLVQAATEALECQTQAQTQAQTSAATTRPKQEKHHISFLVN